MGSCSVRFDGGVDRLRLLVAELEGERERVARLAAELPRALEALQRADPDVLVVYGSAALLESFYTGMEKAFRRIAATLGGLPAGEAWHRDLLASMTLEIEEQRPAVLSPETANALDPYLAFRHRFRNLYVFELERAPLVALLERAPDAHHRFGSDLSAFVERLRGWIRSLS